MKKMFFGCCTMAAIFMACNNNPGTTAGSSTSSITLPYTAGYSTDFNNNVSDSDLLLVLNSYKYWENADYKALRSTMGDSMVVEASDGFKFNGRADSLMKTWQTFRDSLSTVVIKMEVWLKNHSLKDSSNYINVWYKEIDTYKSGRVDSMNFADVNMVKNGKIVWYSQFKQKLK